MDLKERIIDALRPEIRAFASHVDPENDRYNLITYQQEDFLSSLADKVIEAIGEAEEGLRTARTSESTAEAPEHRRTYGNSDEKPKVSMDI